MLHQLFFDSQLHFKLPEADGTDRGSLIPLWLFHCAILGAMCGRSHAGWKDWGNVGNSVSKGWMSPNQITYTLRCEVLGAPATPEHPSVGPSPCQGFHWETVNPEKVQHPPLHYLIPVHQGAFFLPGSSSLARCCSAAPRCTGIQWDWLGLPACTHHAAILSPCPSHARVAQANPQVSQQDSTGGEASYTCILGTLFSTL